MSSTVLRKGRQITVDDTDMKVGDILDMESMTLVLQHYFWQGYDKCPLCKSKKTYHKMRLKEDVEQANCLMESGIESMRDYLNPHLVGTERFLFKKDICLKCGNVWVGQMFIWTVLRRKGKLERNIKRIKEWWLKYK